MEKSVYLIKRTTKKKARTDQTGLGFSVIPGLILSQIISQHYLMGVSAGSRLIVTLLIILSYVLLTKVPYLCIAVALFNAVMYIGMIWALADKLSEPWMRILLKSCSAVIIVLVEIGICTDVMQKQSDIREKAYR